MSRYIDADAMDKRRIDYIVDGYAESVADMTEWGMALIEAPTIDIVRCGECKHMTPDGRCEVFADDAIRPSVSDFCSYGERRPMTMLMEDWLRGCVHHDGRKGYVYLPKDEVLQIADYIQRTRTSGTDGLIERPSIKGSEDE